MSWEIVECLSLIWKNREESKKKAKKYEFNIHRIQKKPNGLRISISIVIGRRKIEKSIEMEKKRNNYGV